MTEPLVLLHGIGSHRHVWAPVVPLLERLRAYEPPEVPRWIDVEGT